MAVYGSFLLQMSFVSSPSQSGDPFVLVLFKYFHDTSEDVQGSVQIDIETI